MNGSSTSKDYDSDEEVTVDDTQTMSLYMFVKSHTLNMPLILTSEMWINFSTIRQVALSRMFLKWMGWLTQKNCFYDLQKKLEKNMDKCGIRYHKNNHYSSVEYEIVLDLYEFKKFLVASKLAKHFKKNILEYIKLEQIYFEYLASRTLNNETLNAVHGIKVQIDSLRSDLFSTNRPEISPSFKV